MLQSLKMEASTSLDDIFENVRPQSTAFTVVLMAICLVPMVLLVTWLGTLIRSWPSEPGSGKEPPVAPYSIPYLQHMISFLLDPYGLLQSLREKYPETPFTLTMMNTKFHVFSSPVTAAKIFGKSREYAFEPVIASMMQNGVNLPPQDLVKFMVHKRSPGSHSGKEDGTGEFVSLNHSVYIKYLSGKRLDDIMKVYFEHFAAVLAKNATYNSIGEDWKTIPLNATLQKIIFDTSAVTFFGTRLQKLWPDMWHDFKLFNDAAYAGVRSNMAFVLQPRAYLARERMLKAFEKWVDCEVEDWEEVSGVWSEKWGIRMNWEREKMARQFGFTHRGRACLQAGFLFVIITNAAPMTTWLLLCIIQDSGRLARFQQEAQTILLPRGPSADSNDLSFDISKLKANIYIQGIWKEALRLGSATAAARVVVDDAEIEGYLVRKGSVVLLPVALMHFDPVIFPSPSAFKPERWHTSLPESASEDEKLLAADRMRKQNSSFRTFGGGTGLCSGRFVAEQEVLTAVCTLLLLFDIEFEKGHENFTLNHRTLGIMNPKIEPRIRMRRRDGQRKVQ